MKHIPRVTEKACCICKQRFKTSKTQVVTCEPLCRSIRALEMKSEWCAREALALRRANGLVKGLRACAKCGGPGPCLCQLPRRKRRSL